LEADDLGMPLTPAADDWGTINWANNWGQGLG